MIKQFTDLSANERTYLAWLRTALALIAFGFMLERFDLFLQMFSMAVPAERLLHTGVFGRDAGIGMVAMGILVILLSTIRFTSSVRRIRSEREEGYDIRGVLAIGGVFFILAILILLYISKVLTIS
jgi:putative membrane protein